LIASVFPAENGGMRIRRSKEEMVKVVEQYRASGMTRVEFSRRSGIALSTLSNYCRQLKSCGLVRVNLQEPGGQECRFALLLAKGRRIEIGSHYDESALVRLIRAVEAA
jgi:DNA-binding transcriptional regulator LsrR (DeoR family)